MQNIKSHPLLFFFPLAFLLSWYPWALAYLRGSGNGGPNPLGVFLAGIIVTALVAGKPGLKQFFARLVRWRVGIQWYAVIFLLPIVTCGIAALLNVLLGAAVPDFTKMSRWQDIVEKFLFIFLFIGLGEEPGWRGFALETLQQKKSPIVASAILGPIWAFWHLPLMGTEFALPVIPAFLISVLAGTFIQTWIYNNTRGSVLIQMLFHTAVNTFGAGLIFPMIAGGDIVPFWYIYATSWLVIAIGLVLSGKMQSKHAQPAPKLQPAMQL